MNKFFLICLSVLCFPLIALSQTFPFTGTVTDGESGDPLFGVDVVINESGTTTDFDGNFKLDLPNGEHTVTFSYVGFDPIVQTFTIAGAPYVLNVKLGGVELLNEIVVTADIARDRETPVAFTNIPTAKIEEELASQDIPMILNSTPGAYATNSGGGDGDARVSIRGFNQRNIAVMLDGIPVNDMENGWVYWSNWFGLDLVTKTMQVQRGLGASKLAIPSVGGTINILTKGIDSKRGFKFKQEVGTDGKYRSTLGLTSGRLKNGWGVSSAFSFKRGPGWVDQTYTKGYFYYLRVDKEFNNHLISVSGFGAPQSHGQRAFKTEIASVDTLRAKELGVNSDQFPFYNNMGLRYNQHWGYLARNTINEMGDTTFAENKAINTRENFYHKPQFSIRHSWDVNEKFYLANVAYLSIGKGGGTGTTGTFDRITDPNDPNYGQMDLQTPYYTNISTNLFKPEKNSENILRASHNEHFWYGLLSTFRYNVSPKFNVFGGVDLRSYRGNHFRRVHDLLGGDYYINASNARVDPTTQWQEGDKIVYDNSGFVRWGGLFGLVEYKHNKLSAFLNASSAVSAYKLEDYMKPKVVSLADTTLYVAYDEPAIHDGVTYTLDSPEAQNQKIDWIAIPSFTVKTGANYKINQNHNVFVNTGYLSRATRFSNVISDNRFLPDVPVQEFANSENEKILAFELGYGFANKKFAANINGYFTNWANKPLDSPPTTICPGEDINDPEADRCPINISGISAAHRGFEVDFAYKIHEKVTVEGVASVGDWIWTSEANAVLPDGQEVSFDPTGVHVGDQAQMQFGGLVRVEPIKGLYFKVNGTFFTKNYADFNPQNLEGEDARRESWKLPSYFLMNVHAGYNFKVKDLRMGIRANVLNALNSLYISDGTNNSRFVFGSHADFDAKSATVHFGQGIRFNTSFQIAF